jgi:transposase-like protein
LEGRVIIVGVVDAPFGEDGRDGAAFVAGCSAGNRPWSLAVLLLGPRQVAILRALAGSADGLSRAALQTALWGAAPERAARRRAQTGRQKDSLSDSLRCLFEWQLVRPAGEDGRALSGQAQLVLEHVAGLPDGQGCQLTCQAAACPHCHQAEDQVEAGLNPTGSQRCRCLRCGRSYTPKPSRRGCGEALRRQAIQRYLDYPDDTFQAYACASGVSRRTVARWLEPYVGCWPKPPFSRRFLEIPAGRRARRPAGAGVSGAGDPAQPAAPGDRTEMPAADSKEEAANGTRDSRRPQP